MGRRESRPTLHGKLAKAKPWNCTTRFSHFVHDTIAERRSDCVCHCHWRGQWRTCVYGAAYLTCLWAWGKFTYGNRRFSLRVGRSSILFLPARNPNWYEVSVFGIQCKSFKLEMRSEEEPPPANPSATDWQLDCGSDWRSSSSGDLDQLEEWVSAPSSHVMCAKWQGEGSTTENRSDIVLKYQNQVSPTFSPQREVFTSMWVSCLSDDKAESRDNIVASILCQIYI